MPLKKNKAAKLSNALSELKISTPKPDKPSSSLVFSEEPDPDIYAKWPKPKIKAQDIFLHKPADFSRHVHKLLSNNVSFHHPVIKNRYTKITCPSFNDHKAIVQYFDKLGLPYHTFGNPSKRKMKVVIRGLPNEMDLHVLKKELKGGNIPVVRIHKMHRRENIKDPNCLVLVVVPNDDNGRKLLLLKQILGYNIIIEPVKEKTKQCYRCQMWGHSQRYCHGEIRCVKCAGNHLSKKCDRDPDSVPIKCANCGNDHVASYRNCPCCPESVIHKLFQDIKNNIRIKRSNREIVTGQTCKQLYKNIKY